MNNLSKKIENLIKEELTLINQKINGVVLLEILKYKILDKLKADNVNVSFDNDEKIIETNIDDNNRSLGVKIIYSKSPVINLNYEVVSDLLLLCINEVLNINIHNNEVVKNFSYKCLPMTGLVISKGSKCSLNYGKNSIVLEISFKDKILDIEKLNEATI